MASHIYASTVLATAPNFGAWLRKLREGKGLAQRQIAGKADMDSSHYGKIETGKRLPTEAQASAIADILGVAEDDFLARLHAARVLDRCDGNPSLAAKTAALLQEAAGPYFVNNPASKP